MATILIIDDVEEIRENLAEYLELKGYDVLVGNNGSEGIELIRKNEFDLVVCDVVMPQKNGFDVLDYLKSKPETRNIPFIFLSASAQKEEIEKGASSPADAYLIKPFPFADLEDTIRKLLNPTG